MEKVTVEFLRQRVKELKAQEQQLFAQANAARGAAEALEYVAKLMEEQEEPDKQEQKVLSKEELEETLGGKIEGVVPAKKKK